MKKLVCFLFLMAFTVMFASVVTANEPPGQYQTFNSAISTNYMENLPIYVVDPAVLSFQDFYDVPTISEMIIQPAEVNSVFQNYAMDPEVQSRSGVIINDYLFSIYNNLSQIDPVKQAILNAGNTTKSYTLMGYSIWS